jgi:hypothetical protein
MMEQVKEKLGEVMNAFVQQELGNKITQFNMQGLVMILMAGLDELVVESVENDKQKK